MESRIPDLGRFAEPALLILVSLSDGPKHGYAIMTDVEAGTGRPLGPGTLYAALARLEERGLIEALRAERSAPAVPADRRSARRSSPSSSASCAAFAQVGLQRLGESTRMIRLLLRLYPARLARSGTATSSRRSSRSGRSARSTSRTSSSPPSTLVSARAGASRRVLVHKEHCHDASHRGLRRAARRPAVGRRTPGGLRSCRRRVRRTLARPGHRRDGVAAGGVRGAELVPIPALPGARLGRVPDPGCRSGGLGGRAPRDAARRGATVRARLRRMDRVADRIDRDARRLGTVRRRDACNAHVVQDRGRARRGQLAADRPELEPGSRGAGGRRCRPASSPRWRRSQPAGSRSARARCASRIDAPSFPGAGLAG